MNQMFNNADPYSGFLGAYNMGVWGVSVSGKPPLTPGLLESGDVMKQAPQFTKETSENPKAKNFVAFYDTPNIWGYGDDTQDDWSKIATKENVQKKIDEQGAWTHLVNRWKAVIAQSRYLVDITSLSPPVTNSEVQIAVCEGISQCLKAWISSATKDPERAPKLMIRILFGMAAAQMYGTGANTYWNEFYYELEKTLKPLRDKINAIKKVKHLPELLYGSDMGKMISTFNHSKIVAGDGQYAIVGGHNMCEEVSSNKAPVIHDITSEVTGPGSRSANAFAGSLWLKAAESGRLYIYRFNWAKNKFDDLSNDSTRKWAPNNYWYYELGDQKEVSKVIKNQYWYYPMQSLPVKAEVDPPAGSVPATAVMGVGRWGDTKVFGIKSKGLKYNTDIKLEKACHYASDLVKRLMINDKNHTVIGMSQQDLVNDGVFGQAQGSDHVICEIIGNRLKSTPKGLAIQIVVSSRFTQNCEGLAYSYGDGPREAAERIANSAAGRLGLSSFDKSQSRLAILHLSASPGSAQVNAIPSSTDPSFCTVAPLAFCEARGATRNRGSYVWPDSSYKMERIYTSGRFWNDEDANDLKFGPGSHAKILYVSEGNDDATGLVMIGSDNMYPSPLSEFNFVIEGPEAIKAFRQQYWDRLWGYSARLGFTVKSDGSVS